MTSKGKIERWLLADWNGDRLLKSSSMIRVTEEVNIGIPETNQRVETPKDDVTSGNNSFEGRRSLRAIENNTSANASISKTKNEERDYSPSASSWEPSDDEISSDSASEHSFVSQKTSFTKQYSNKKVCKKGPKPAHRANDVIINILKSRQINDNSNNIVATNRKRPHKDSMNAVKKYSADSTKRNHTLIEKRTTDIYTREIQEIKEGFQEVFRMLSDLKQFGMKVYPERDLPATVNDTAIGFEENEDNDRSESEDSDRSDDNVLISNKYSRIEQHVTTKKYTKNDNHDEWVPIGSGMTLIHKDKFRRVNWKSYTIATRTLLLAAFPRRILATHSLTGKRSPAFLNKPPKMCLDPKIVTDIILEITSRFNVKENLVRGIITTKCADECKMFKTRVKSKNKSKNDENAQPATEAEKK